MAGAHRLTVAVVVTFFALLALARAHNKPDCDSGEDTTTTTATTTEDPPCGGGDDSNETTTPAADTCQCVCPADSTTTPSTTTTTEAPTTTTTQCCYRWSEWTANSTCSASCGSCGKQTLVRTCETEDEGCPCVGESTKTAICNPTPCKYPAKSCCSTYKVVGGSEGIACNSPLPDMSAETCDS